MFGTIRNRNEAYFFFLSLISLCSCSLHAWPRLGVGATPTFNNTGTRAQGISVSANDTTPTLIYSGLDTDREILIQNTSATYDVWIGTSSSVRATTGPRAKLRPKQDFTTDGTANLYVIVDTGGGTVEITGWIEFDPRDR